VDETAELKKGTCTVGVARQHARDHRAGGELLDRGVHAYVTGHGHAPYDFRLYLPRQWCDDEQRRGRAQVPGNVAFKTKTELAADIVTGAISGGTLFGWLAATRSTAALASCGPSASRPGKGYVLAVPVGFKVRWGAVPVGSVPVPVRGRLVPQPQPPAPLPASPPTSPAPRPGAARASAVPHA
jgi:hypothetical protein